MMEKSNLRIYSNIYRWDGRWSSSDQWFIEKIWDESALAILRGLERKKELVLTERQLERYRYNIQCPELPLGERPWGWVSPDKKVCLCRKSECPRFRGCRAGNSEVSEREREIWSGGSREGAAAFEQAWRENGQESVDEPRDTGDVDLNRIFENDGEYEKLPCEGEVDAGDPNIAIGYPDDEEYE